MRILLTDTETSSLSYAEGGRVVEVAAALFDTRYASVIESFSCLIQHETNEAESFNGIPAELIAKQGLEPGEVWERFLRLAVDAECYVAHNASFDQGFVASSVVAVGWDSWPELRELWDPYKPWVCTMSDVKWPGTRKSHSLVQLALSLGLGVSSAHRAMTDVDTMARCLTRAQEIMLHSAIGAEFAFGGSNLPANLDMLEPLIRLGMRPKKRFVARVPFEMNHLLKQHGFTFTDKPRKEWFRRMPPEEAEKLPFRVVVSEDENDLIELGKSLNIMLAEIDDLSYSDVVKAWVRDYPNRISEAHDRVQIRLNEKRAMTRLTV